MRFALFFHCSDIIHVSCIAERIFTTFRFFDSASRHYGSWADAVTFTLLEMRNMCNKNLEVVHELVFVVKDMKQVSTGLLVDRVNHLIKDTVEVLHKHRLHCPPTATHTLIYAIKTPTGRSTTVTSLWHNHNYITVSPSLLQHPFLSIVQLRNVLLKKHLIAKTAARLWLLSMWFKLRTL